VGLAYHSFEDLEVWKRACRIAVSTYEVLKDCRDYGLRDQMTRAAISIASNIAEGAERNSTPDFIRFLNIAKGSAAELRTQIYIAERIGVLTNTQNKVLINELKEISAMLHGLAKALRKQTAHLKLKT
jgi:four helix bundle protein